VLTRPLGRRGVAATQRAALDATQPSLVPIPLLSHRPGHTRSALLTGNTPRACLASPLPRGSRVGATNQRTGRHLLTGGHRCFSLPIPSAHHLSAEVSGLQWLNTLLSASWPSALEVVVSALAKENLQEALDKARCSDLVRPSRVTIS
jgi:hypothetical protein